MFNNMLSGEDNMACSICGFYSINTPIWPISVCQSDVPECWGWNWRLQSTLTRQYKLAPAHHCTQENKLKNGSRFLLRSKASKRTEAQLKLVIEKRDINLEFFNGAKYLSKINIKTLLLKQELNLNEKEVTTSRPTLQ